MAACRADTEAMTTLCGFVCAHPAEMRLKMDYIMEANPPNELACNEEQLEALLRSFIEGAV